MRTGLKIGEVDSDSAIIWARRTRVLPTDGAAGASGELQITYWPIDRSGQRRTSEWIQVSAEGDGVHQFKLETLTPATSYAIEVRTRFDESGVEQALRGSFRTAPCDSESADVRFVVVTGQDYHRRDDGERGHRLYEAMRSLEPSFFVHTGDVIYYDKPDPEARDVETARFHWHRMYSLPNQRQFHLNVPSYFLKDDHDTLKNDCWPGQTYGELTFERGVELFREQTPAGARPYRKVRWGRHLEMWFLEGREFRSANRDPDGPDKTILGREQLEWLERTLGESDATFRVVVSATPIVGPDRSNKADNHSNNSFANEGGRLRRLLAEFERVIVVCGDRHWQYVSVDPETGLWEFSCGPTTDAHAGGFTADQRTEAHRYLAVRGGFLSVTIDAEDQDEEAEMLLRHHDPTGLVLHTERFASGEEGRPGH